LTLWRKIDLDFAIMLLVNLQAKNNVHLLNSLSAKLWIVLQRVSNALSKEDREN
jgi:hypothetical protein